MQELEEETRSLMEMVGSLKTQLEEKDRLIKAEFEASEHIGQRLTEAETANEKLAEKVGYLSEIEQQFR